MLPLITKLELSTVEVPFAAAHGYRVSYGTRTTTSAVVLKLSTSSGITGYGEANPLPPFSEETISSISQTIVTVFAPLVLGENALHHARLRYLLDDALPDNYMAKGAVDMAVWDICGKHFGVPVHELLGGALTHELPLLWPLSVQSREEDEKDLTAKYQEGYRTFMLKMGGAAAGRSIEEEIERLQAASARFSDIHLVCDANQGWSVSEAKRFFAAAEGIHKFDLMIEQPVLAAQDHAFSLLRSSSHHKLSADESVKSVADVLRLCASHSVDVFSLKVSKNGGISRMREMGAAAAHHGVQVLVNSMLELGITQAAALNLALTMPNLLPIGHCFMSTLRLADDVTNFRSELVVGEAASVKAPTKPGLGIEVIEDKLKKYEVSYTCVTKEGVTTARGNA